MIDKILGKIRALIEDAPSQSDVETFTYSNSSVFTLAEENISDITQVTKNGTALGSGEYSYDSTTNELTVTASLSDGDIIIVKYTFYKYSETELEEFVRASLVWISVFSYCETDYELEDSEIFPTPSNKDTDLIALIGSILIKPDYSQYKLPNLTVNYPRTMPKEERIEKLIKKFSQGLGVCEILEWD